MTVSAERIADHRAALARIAPEEMAVLTQADDFKGIIRLGTHAGLLVATGGLVLASEGILQIAVQALHGIVLVFLFAACHEAIHRTAFATGWMNDRLAQVTGFLLVLPPNAFRFFHFAHHRFTQDPARDPELETPKPRNLLEYLLVLSGWRYWSGQVVSVVRAALGLPLPGHVPPRGEARVRGEARAFLAGYAGIALVSVISGSGLAWELWVLPAILGQPVLRAYLLAEHTGLPLGRDMLRNTRTTVTARALSWLAWEGNFHTAHHAAPMVPFHKLAALTARLRPAKIAEAEGYVEAHRQILSALGKPA